MTTPEIIETIADVNFIYALCEPLNKRLVYVFLRVEPRGRHTHLACVVVPTPGDRWNCLTQIGRRRNNARCHTPVLERTAYSGL